MMGTSHAYAKASMVSTLLALAVSHQAELSAIATIIAIAAGVVSIIKAIIEKKR